MLGQVFAFPSNDKDEFGSQSKQIGTKMGGFLRDIIGIDNDQILEETAKTKKNEKAAEKTLKEDPVAQKCHLLFKKDISKMSSISPDYRKNAEYFDWRIPHEKDIKKCKDANLFHPQ